MLQHTSCTIVCFLQQFVTCPQIFGYTYIYTHTRISSWHLKSTEQTFSKIGIQFVFCIFAKLVYCYWNFILMISSWFSFHRYRLKGNAPLEVEACHVLQYESKLLSLEARRRRKRHMTGRATLRTKKTGKAWSRNKHNMEIALEYINSIYLHWSIFPAALRSKAITIVNTQQWTWGNWRGRGAKTTGKAGAHNVSGTHRPSAHPVAEAPN